MSRMPILLLPLCVIACSDEPAAPTVSLPLTPEFTVGSGVTGERLAQATFAIRKLKRINKEYDWQVELKAKPALDIAVRRFTYAAGSQTGWHMHPGPVFIQVVSGTVIFYEAPDCKRIEVRAGESYLDLGEHAHIGRNETGEPAQDVTVLFGPPGINPDDLREDVSPAPCELPVLD
jgi:quercetin dioxygenase-like cupin family protein